MKLNVFLIFFSLCLAKNILQKRSADFLQKVMSGSDELDEYDLKQLLSHMKQINEFGILNGLF
jgi:hypothetical protein